MIKITKEIIDEVNKSVDSWNHGIYSEPFGIPNYIKEPVIYCRYETGGVSGGSCWESSNPQPYSIDSEDYPEFEALERLLDIVCPNISRKDYKKLLSLIESNTESEYEYYGNCTDYKIQFIKVSDFERFINLI